MPTSISKESNGISRRDALKAVGAAATATAVTAVTATAFGTSAVNAATTAPAKPLGRAKQPPKMNGAQAFFRTLEKGGVDTVFGCPGTSEMQIIQELGQSDMKAVLGLQENVVTGMAHGYGVMADKPSLALLHVACGVSNGLSNMHNGRRAGAPMIVFAGGVAASHEVNNPEHQMLLRPHQIAAAAVDWAREARTSDLLADAAAAAIQAANQGTGQVAMVYGPAQTFWEEATVMEDQLPPIPPRRVDKSTIREIAQSLQSGGKTCLLLGGHALRHE